jgi:hypothetical protein
MAGSISHELLAGLTHQPEEQVQLNPDIKEEQLTETQLFLRIDHGCYHQ